MKPIDLVGDGLGWIKSYRKTLESEVWALGPVAYYVWSYCLHRANHKTKWVTVNSGRGPRKIHVQRGSFIFGRKSAHKGMFENVPESTIYRYIKKLEAMNMIVVNSKEDKQFSIISIVNWNTYQGDPKKVDKQPDRLRTDYEQTTNTNNNDKNEKNENIPADVISWKLPEQVVKIYHGVLPELPKVVKLTPQRELAINWVVSNHPEARATEWWESYFKLARKYPMVMDPEGVFAPQKPQFKPNFDWLLLGRNVTKILEGGWPIYEVDPVDKSGSTDYSQYLNQKESK